MMHQGPPCVPHQIVQLTGIVCAGEDTQSQLQGQPDADEKGVKSGGSDAHLRMTSERAASTGLLPALRTRRQECLHCLACPKRMRIASATAPAYLFKPGEDPLQVCVAFPLRSVEARGTGTEEGSQRL